MTGPGTAKLSKGRKIVGSKFGNQAEVGLAGGHRPGRRRVSKNGRGPRCGWADRVVGV